MKQDELDELLGSVDPSVPLNAEHRVRLRSRIDLAAIQPERPSLDLIPKRSARKRNFALAASIAVAATIGIAVWVGQAALSPEPSWAHGVEMSSAQRDTSLNLCLSQVESDVDGVTVSDADLKGSTLMMAEDRGEQGAIWFKTPKGDLGTCMVSYDVGQEPTLDFSMLWSGPNTYVSGRNVSEQNVHSVSLKEDTDGNLYQEHTIFGLTDSTITGLQAEFVNGTTSDGIVRNGLFFLMNRVEVNDPDAVMSNLDGAATRIVFTRADGSGFTETHTIHPDYQGNGDHPQIEQF